MISTINFERGGEHLELGVYSKIFTDVRESRLVDASHWTPRNCFCNYLSVRRSSIIKCRYFARSWRCTQNSAEIHHCWYSYSLFTMDFRRSESRQMRRHVVLPDLHFQVEVTWQRLFEADWKQSNRFRRRVRIALA